ncbi:MAG: hypothetical protein WC628_06375 [Candidatus Omnitrophota bacterium]
MISYISFLCIVSLVLKKDNKFALFHAKNGLVLFVLEVAGFILSVIPILGWLINGLGCALFFLVSLWGIYQAYRGQEINIPIVSEIAGKIVL